MAWSKDAKAKYDHSYWDIVWDRPYINYESHHQVIWNEVRKRATGKILDLACGSASCWKDLPAKSDTFVTGIDFSVSAIREARKNYPPGRFYVGDVFHVPVNDTFDTVCAIGLVNYYLDLEEFKQELIRLTHEGSKILISINVIQDFPERYWDINQIEKEFRPLGKIKADYYDQIGWLVEIDR